jgi:hypothetical protein
LARERSAALEDLHGCVRLRAWGLTRTRAEQNGGGGDVLAAETKGNVLRRSWRRCTRLAEMIQGPWWKTVGVALEREDALATPWTRGKVDVLAAEEEQQPATRRKRAAGGRQEAERKGE